MLREVLWFVAVACLVDCSLMLFLIHGQLSGILSSIEDLSKRLDGIHEELTEASLSLTTIEDQLERNSAAIRRSGTPTASPE